MTTSTARLAAASLSLAVIWIAVYWWWEPREGRISFAQPPAPVEVGRTPPAGSGREPRPQPPPLETAPQPEPRPEERPVPQPVTPAPQPEPGIIPPEFDSYIIQRGDTFSSISQKFFGTAAHASRIAESNPFVSPDRLREGREIRIPRDPGNIQGKPNPSAPRTDPPPAIPPVEREYTVRPGDTLSAIAKREYGSTAYVDFIIRANRDLLPDPDMLKVGQKLRLPPRPADATGGR